MKLLSVNVTDMDVMFKLKRKTQCENIWETINVNHWKAEVFLVCWLEKLCSTVEVSVQVPSCQLSFGAVIIASISFHKHATNESLIADFLRFTCHFWIVQIQFYHNTGWANLLIIWSMVIQGDAAWQSGRSHSWVCTILD